jgi:transcription termination factor Rho
LREKYETLKLNDLREIAKKRGIKGASGMKKSQIIDLMCRMDEEESSSSEPAREVNEEQPKAPAQKKTRTRTSDDSSNSGKAESPARKKRIVVTTSNAGNAQAASPAEAPAPKPDNIKPMPAREEEKPEPAEEIADGDSADGILEVMQDGYGFIRCENYLPGENDVYVAPSLIRKFNLKTGDILTGVCRPKKETDKFAALSRLDSVNGYKPEVAMGRWDFEKMTPIFPNNKIRLEQPGCSVAMRIMDLISPIGKGQRGMIVSPPKAGKTTLLKEVAKSVLKNSSDIHLIILLIDERPEEVTDIKESIEGPNAEVIYSTFDELPEHHKRVAEMVMERAKRLVEHGKDVVILLDSITRLTRAYNIVVPPSGRTLSGGLDPAALHMPKRFFGAARNMREGGSLTILATALIETGSKMDDVIYEEFKGTGNMEMVLDRKLQEKRIFPAINIPKSSTRREDLLLTQEELTAINSLRKGFNGMKADDAVDQCINLFSKTRNNMEFVRMVEKQIRF